MRVKALYEDCSKINLDIKKFGYSKESELEITIDKEYEVHALSVFKGIVYLQIVDDINYPNWIPAVFFQVLEKTVPRDWICNYFDSEPCFLLGPEFVVSNINSYNSMVQLELHEVGLFWSRIKNLE